MKLLAAFVSGLLFATGLVLSGMTQPSYVVGFLDFFGNWKPQLLFVMIGALTVYALVSHLVLKRPLPLFNDAFDRPVSNKIDARLIAGAVIFGIGWGLSGVCPGPAVVAFTTGAREAIIALTSIVAGIIIYRFVTRPANGAPDEPTCG